MARIAQEAEALARCPTCRRLVAFVLDEIVTPEIKKGRTPSWKETQVAHVVCPEDQGKIPLDVSSLPTSWWVKLGRRAENS